VTDFAEELGFVVDGGAVRQDFATQGALGLVINNNALSLLNIVDRLRFKLDGYL
jgi:hypothetical protein